MTVREALYKSRSYRRFYQDQRIPQEDFLTMVDAARVSPSGKNIQPLKYFIVSDTDLCDRVFSTLAWAGFLTDWDGPEEGERPSGYIVQLLDTNIATATICDEGITAQSILLQATELGWGGCIIASVKRDTLREILSLPAHLQIKNVLALGRPKEQVVLEDMQDGEYRYWRTPDAVHHVPKRSLEEIIIR